jgi:S1-C subfamily serine protease
MLRRSSVVSALLLAVSSLPAQEVSAPTLLRPRDSEATDPARKAGLAGITGAVRASVVHVLVEVDGPRGKFPLVRSSSGVVIDASGLVVTFRHLVREAQGAADKRILVQLDDAANTQLPATIEALDSDLALLRVQPPAGGLTAAKPGPDRPAAGEPLLVLARPDGKAMLAFAGVASPALGPVKLGGVAPAADQIFLADARNDERSDGAPVFDGDGRLLGLYASEHVQRDQSEPTLEDLKKPSFGVVVAMARIRQAFAKVLPKAGAAAKPAPQVLGVQRAAPSVVSVWSGDGEWPQPGAKDPGGVVRRSGLGSGVVLTAAGLVVCNAHVVKGDAPRLRLLDGRTFAAKVVKTHGPTNLALLQAELPAGTQLVPIAANRDDDVQVGELALALGNPYGTAVVVSGGVISAVRDRDGGRIQADMNLGNQNGGGAVIDVHGRLLGIGDAGAIDPIDAQFAMRGDRISTETNLSTFVSVARLRRLFGDALEAMPAPAEAAAAERELRRSALARMVEASSGAMLNIYVQRSITKVDEDDPFASLKEPEFAPISLGSGVIIDRSGLAISNWHVVDDATRPDGSMVADHRVTARAFGGKEYRVQVLSISREDDLSLLQLQLEPGEQVPAVELGSSDALALGEWVAAIGNPHGRANTVTFGVVSAEDQELRVKGRWAKLEHLIETDAAINGGNSGGALLDMNGRLVGINSAGGGTFNNKGYAIAVDHVRKQVLTLLLAAYKLRSPDLGMRIVDEDGVVKVFDCDPRGPAAAAGVQSGDRIVSLDGEKIVWSPGFALALKNKTPGVAVSLGLERQGAPKTIECKPLSAPVWAVVRQSGLLVRDFEYAEDGERVRQAAIALHRAFTGDRTGEPQRIPERMVLVERVHPGEQPAGADVQAGDLLLAVELRDQAGNPVLQPLADVTALRDVWNDRELGSYDGQVWKVWRARGAEVKAVELVGKRLFW